MLNKISYLTKSASLVCALFFVSMIQATQKPSTMSPGPKIDRILTPGPKID